MASVVWLLLYGCLSQVNIGNCCVAGHNETAAADSEGASSNMSSADTQAGLTHPVSGATAVPSTNSASSNSTGKSGKGGNSGAGAAPPMPSPASTNSARSSSTGKSGKGGSSGAAPPRLPDVATLLDTMRKRLEALNGPALPRI